MKDTRQIARLRRTLMSAQLSAAAHVRNVVRGDHPDAHVPWLEVTGRTRAALMLAQGSMAAERAQVLSDAPKQLGVIVVHRRLEDTPQNRVAWEADAKQLGEARVVADEEALKVGNGS